MGGLRQAAKSSRGAGGPRPARASQRRKGRRCYSIAAFGIVTAALCGAEAKPPRKEVVPRSEPTDPCSRVISRQTRKHIEKEVLKPASKQGIDKWPEGCAFDPNLDKYGHQEKQKQRKHGGSSWTCGICGKTFKNEYYLDLHLERRHVAETSGRPVCAADFCEVFESCQESVHPRRRKNVTCDDELLAMTRRRCEEALSTCLPLDQEKSRQFHAQLSRHFCQVLTCRIREEMQRDTDYVHMPVVVLLILIIIICLMAFGCMVCCVDYSDDITMFLLNSRVASLGFVKHLVKAKEKSREKMGMDRTKRI